MSSRGTRAHNIRLDDELWDRAVHIADVWETDVSSMVRVFLKELRTNVDPAIMARRTVGRMKKGVDGDCEHQLVKTVSYGTFCRECGVKLG